MKNVRIIPRLDIKGPNVVKPVHAEALRIVGSPEELARRYYEQGADEILYIDIVASLYQRSLDLEILKNVSRDIFIPITVGGGIQTVREMNNALRAGADKIAINTQAIRKPKLISSDLKEFGSQCILLSLDAKRRPNLTWEAYTDGGREPSGVDAIEWAKQAIYLGAGEILVSSIDQDGTLKGYDYALIREIASIAPIPVIACGGASSLESILLAIDSGADAIAAASIFHYNDFTIQDVKKFLANKKIGVRLDP